MSDFSPTTMIALGVAVFFLCAMVWWAVRRAPPMARIATRIVVGTASLVSLALLFLASEMELRAPLPEVAAPTQQTPEVAEKKQAAKPEGVEPEKDTATASAQEKAARAEARRVEEEAERRIGELAAERKEEMERGAAEKGATAQSSEVLEQERREPSAGAAPSSGGLTQLPEIGGATRGSRATGESSQKKSYSRSFRRPEASGAPPSAKMARPARPEFQPSAVPPPSATAPTAAPQIAPPPETEMAAPEAEMAVVPSESPKESENEDWSVVPVFYGTDRERKSTNTEATEKISYDWQRGRRLELGRALVTIPKDHVVPMVERPWAIRIPYINVTLYEAEEDPKEHFTIKELKALTREEFLDLVRMRLAGSTRFKDHALVFVHGYKTTFENAIFRTAQISYDLKFDGAPFLYSWPSGGTLQGYTYDRESTAQAEPYLRKFLEMVVSDTGAKKVSIIAHSMGNQLLLRVLQDLKRSLPDGVLISQLVLAAPDVDRDSFEYIVGSIQGIAEGITLYSAANDQALQISRRVNGGVPRAGDVPDDGPIILEGVDTIDATASSMDSIGINHSGYAENNALLEDIGRLISSGLRPPEKRVPTLERVTIDRGTYWRYPAIAVPDVAGTGK